MRTINRLHWLLASILLLPVAFSCVEDVEIDSNEDKPIVVDCVLKSGNHQTLRMYRLRKLYQDEYEEIEGATVELFKKDEGGENYSKVTQFVHVEGPDWEAFYTPDFEAKYMLKVSIHSKEVIHAYTTFPSDLRLMLHMTSMTLEEGDAKRRYFAITGEVSEPTLTFYYGYKQVSKPDLSRFPVYEYSVKPCKMWIFPHVDSTIVMKPDNKYSVFDQDKVKFSGTSKPYVKYVVTDHLGADDFNIVDGSISDLDFFNVPLGSYTFTFRPMGISYDLNLSQWCLSKVPDLPLHDRFVRIDHPKGYNNGHEINALGEEELKHEYQFSSHSFLLYADFANYMAAMEPFTLEVRFLSDEYDRFMKELYLKKASRDDFILSTYERKNQYTNIEGGLGIFGAELITWSETAYGFDSWELFFGIFGGRRM